MKEENTSYKKNKKIKEGESTTLVPVKEKKKTFAIKRFFHKKHNYKNHHQEQKLAQDFTTILSKSIKIMIPWLIIPTIIFLVGAYFIFDGVISQYYTPLWYKIIFGIITFGLFLFLGLFYGFAMGIVGSLKLFSQHFGLIFRQATNSLKNSIENRINNLSFDMFSKKEISNVITQSFNDFSKNIKKYAQKTALGFMAIGILTSVLFFARHFIIRSLGVIKNKADVFALISARTSLFIAIILNLTFFTKIILWLGVFVGFVIVLLQALLILYLR